MNKSLIVEYLDNGNFKLIDDFVFYLDDTTSFKIEKGFVTDFGSIPLIFQSIVSPIGKATKAYVLHDYLLTEMYKSNKKAVVSGIMLNDRKVCDDILYKALLKLKVNAKQAKLIYYCVRIYALFKK